MIDWKRECLKLVMVAQQSLLPNGSKEQLKNGVNYVYSLLDSSAKHPKYVRRYKGTLEELVLDISNMTYDKVAEFLYELSKELEKQGDADMARKRKMLAKQLKNAAKDVIKAKKAMDKAWKICEPYMKKENNITLEFDTEDYE